MRYFNKNKITIFYILTKITCVFQLTGTCIYKASLESEYQLRISTGEHNELTQEPIPETSSSPPLKFPAASLKSGASVAPTCQKIMYYSYCETNFVLIVNEVSGGRGCLKKATLILDQHSRGKYFMKTGSRVKIGIFFLVRGTLLILINNVLVKWYCGSLFLWEWRSLRVLLPMLFTGTGVK